MTRSTSAFDDLMTLSAKMPEAAGVALALVSYVAFQILAVRYAAPAVSPINVADLGYVVQRQLVGTLALFLQYIVPVGFLMGAAVSAQRRRRLGLAKGKRAILGSMQAIESCAASERGGPDPQASAAAAPVSAQRQGKCGDEFLRAELIR